MAYKYQFKVYKVWLFVLAVVGLVIIDYVSSRPIYIGQEPTIAIFSDKANKSGGHCSFEIKPK